MNVLAIAPNRDLMVVMERVAAEHPRITTTLMHGDLDHAIASTLTVFHRDFDAVISRGGTAQALEDEFSIPIISIGISAADILTTIARARSDARTIAAVGFSSALKHIPEAAAILGTPIQTFPIDFDDEIEVALKCLAHDTYDLILGDTFSCERAREAGIDAVLLRSGKSSVEDAFDRAEMLALAMRKEHETASLLRDIIRSQDIRIAIYSNDAELAYTTLTSSDTALLEDLARYAREQTPPERFIFRHEGILYTVRSVLRTSNNQREVAFTITSESMPGSDRFCGLSLRSHEEVVRSFDQSAFHCIGADQSLKDALQGLASTNRPLMLLGETGCGKPRIAQLLYLLGAHNSEPFVRISCAVLDNRTWEFLLHNHRSPLLGKSMFIHFDGIASLSAQRWRELLGFLSSTMLSQRCRVVFSSDIGEHGIPEVVHRFAEQLECFTFTVPPMRQLEIGEDAAENYLEALAKADGKRAPTLTAQAAQIAADYPWPRNIMQFKQVMNWVYAEAHEGVIDAQALQNALARDDAARLTTLLPSDAETGAMLDLLKPLSETNAEIAHIVVQSHDGNKSAAAKTLGISRTTLWNLLKRQP